MDEIKWELDGGAKARLYTLIITISGVLAVVFFCLSVGRDSELAGILGVAGALCVGVAFITAVKHGDEVRSWQLGRRPATTEQLDAIYEILVSHAVDPRFASVRSKLEQNVGTLNECDAAALIALVKEVDGADRRAEKLAGIEALVKRSGT
ncbi:MAG: hypothetical protein EPN36_13925 [Rhodanobacteraceae bacterium]|nr:MAG: hypothetical protein EPN36_13925 [Rhodanobacteraceae bacterium]